MGASILVDLIWRNIASALRLVFISNQGVIVVLGFPEHRFLKNLLRRLDDARSNVGSFRNDMRHIPRPSFG